MQNSQKEKAFRERRLNKAARYVTDLWIPVNPAHLTKIRERLDSGAYENQLSLLMQDLKQDPSLFLYCLKELFKLLRSAGDLPDARSQAEIFEEAGLETLKTILSVDAAQISKHDLNATTSLQSSRINEMLTSAAASEVLCEAAQIDPDLGFSAAIFRQLGLALIAWNYPGAYQRALTAKRADESFDHSLARHLGFSPSLLAVRLARGWGVPARFVAPMEDEPDGEEQPFETVEVSDAVSGAIANLCRIGECLARANQPELYPHAADDWNEARNAIEDRCGPAGLQAIRRRFEDYSAAYIDAAPEIFKAGLVLDPEVRLAVMERAAGVDDAILRFHDRCDERMKSKLRELYRAIESNEDTQKLLERWRDGAVAASGFSGGHVFAVEPALGVLIAQFTFGETILQPRESVPLNHGNALITAAFKAGTPIVRDRMRSHEQATSAIAGTFGFSQRVGVLYLELSQINFALNSDRYMIHFRSLAQALNDCLRLA